eukprot:6466667-Lingulodinium_polyedra.AAC.1
MPARPPAGFLPRPRPGGPMAMAAQRGSGRRGSQPRAPPEPPQRQRHALERVVAWAFGCRRA